MIYFDSINHPGRPPEALSTRVRRLYSPTNGGLIKDDLTLDEEKITSALEYCRDHDADLFIDHETELTAIYRHYAFQQGWELVDPSEAEQEADRQALKDLKTFCQAWLSINAPGTTIRLIGYGISSDPAAWTTNPERRAAQLAVYERWNQSYSEVEVSLSSDPYPLDGICPDVSFGNAAEDASLQAYRDEQFSDLHSKFECEVLFFFNCYRYGPSQGKVFSGTEITQIVQFARLHADGVVLWGGIWAGEAWSTEFPSPSPALSWQVVTDGALNIRCAGVLLELRGVSFLTALDLDDVCTILNDAIAVEKATITFGTDSFPFDCGDATFAHSAGTITLTLTPDGTDSTIPPDERASRTETVLTEAGTGTEILTLLGSGTTTLSNENPTTTYADWAEGTEWLDTYLGLAAESMSAIPILNFGIGTIDGLFSDSTGSTMSEGVEVDGHLWLENDHDGNPGGYIIDDADGGFSDFDLPSISTLWRFRFASYPASDGDKWFEFRNSAGGFICSGYVKSTGSFNLLNAGDSGHIDDTDSGTLELDTTYIIAIELTIGTTGTVRYRLWNEATGEEVFDSGSIEANLGTSNVADLKFGDSSNYSSTSYLVYYRDWAIGDGTHIPPYREGQAYQGGYLLLSANGADQDWTPSIGFEGWDALINNPYNPVSYISSSTEDDISMFLPETLDNAFLQGRLPSRVGDILAARLAFRAQAATGNDGALRPRWRSGETTVESDQDLATTQATPEMYSLIRDADPDTGLEWEHEAIESSLFGARNRDTDETRLYDLYILLFYYPQRAGSQTPGIHHVVASIRRRRLLFLG